MIKAASKMIVILGVLSSTACSSYKSSWDCPKVKGIGCSSIEYADEIAREQIILSERKSNKKILISHDIFEEDAYEELEIK